MGRCNRNLNFAKKKLVTPGYFKIFLSVMRKNMYGIQKYIQITIISPSPFSVSQNNVPTILSTHNGIIFV